MYKSLLLLLFIILCIGCNISDKDDDSILVDNRVVVEGIYITAEDSPEVLFAWQDPSPLVYINVSEDSTNESNSSIPDTFGIDVPYPNPAQGHPQLSVYLPLDASVNMWITEARWREEESEEIKTPLTFDIVDQELQAGKHQFTADILVDCLGGDFKAGFYRINIQAYDTTLHVDMYLLGYRENMPQSLKEPTAGYVGCS